MRTALRFALPAFRPASRRTAALTAAALAAAGVLALPGVAQADPPSSTPTTVVATVNGGTVHLQAGSTASQVSFQIDSETALAPVAVEAGTAMLDWASWGYATGTHTVTAYDCDAAGACNTTGAASVSFDLATAAPVLTAPLNLAVLPATGFALHANSDGGSVQFRIDSTPLPLAGTPYATTYSGAALPDGSHTITAVQCAVDDSTHCAGPSSTVTVTVDATPPSLTASANLSTFYPYRDGYEDTLNVSGTVAESTKLTLEIRNSLNKIVYTHTASVTTGRHTLSWNGRNTANTQNVAAGTYHWTLTATDAVGNQKTAGPHGVTVSWKRLVSKTAVLTRKATSYAFVDRVGPSRCAGVSKAGSTFSGGLLMKAQCAPTTPAGAFAGYTFKIPSAVKYGRLTVSTYGYAHKGYIKPVLLAGVYSPRAQDFDDTSVPSRIVRSTTKAWRSFGSVSGDHQTATHVVRVLFVVLNAAAASNFDLKTMKLTATYYVLQ